MSDPPESAAPETHGGAGDPEILDVDELYELLEYLRTARGFDFHGYKRSGLARRITKRMGQVGVAGFGSYLDYLQVHPDEFAALFNTILINVTTFFRDPEAWEVVRTAVVPRIVATKRPDEPIRAWVAACASGEEAYTLAIVLAEAVGPERAREGVKIYATDIDEDALAVARHAAYDERQVQGVPRALLEKYFERTGTGYSFRKDIRRLVIFGRHDLMQDAPISHIDLLACRNALMYFNAETQTRILDRFHFALNNGGFLFLGRAETMMTQGGSFAPIDLKRRISMKISRSSVAERMPSPRADGGPERMPSRDTTAFLLLEAAIEANPVAQLVIDAAGNVAVANERARTFFNLAPENLGRPLQDLRLSYRPVELRSLLDQAMAEGKSVTAKDVEWRENDREVRSLALQVSPLYDQAGSAIGTSVAFTDVTMFKRLQRDLEHVNQELETAYEELQSTNEELETTNEELQSTIEELETTNEELQSTNEELETMNEELQSTNEELHAINDEVRQRGEDLETANAYLRSVLASLSGGVAVVDSELRLLGWNQHAEELWGLRVEEAVGQHLFNLDIGLPLEHLRPAIRACLAGESKREQLQLSAVNRRGKVIECRVTVTPLEAADKTVRGAIILMCHGGEDEFTSA